MVLLAAQLFMEGAAASVVATAFSNPFDVVRARMQVQGANQTKGAYAVLYRSVPQALVRITREEGLTALQKGLYSAVLMQVVLNGIRIGFFPEVKDALRPWVMGAEAAAEAVVEAGGDAVSSSSSSTGAAAAPASAPARHDSFALSLVASALCGCAGSFAASPLTLVKTRLQLQSNVAAVEGAAPASAVPRYSGVGDALLQVWREGGVRGLWHGSLVSAQRTAVGSAAQLTAYDTARHYCAVYLGWAPHDLRLHAVSAVVAAVFVVCCMNPLDVVNTRVYSAANARRAGSGAGAPAYSNNLAKATWQIYRVEGLRGLYKGSTAFFFRSAPHTLISFTVLEWLRRRRLASVAGGEQRQEKPKEGIAASPLAALTEISRTTTAVPTVLGGVTSVVAAATSAEISDDTYNTTDEVFVRTAGLFNA